MKVIITVSAFITSFLLTLLSIACLMSNDIRSNEIHNSLHKGVNYGVETLINDNFLEELSNKDFPNISFATMKGDKFLISVKKNNFSNFIIGTTTVNGSQKCVAMCYAYEDFSIEIQNGITNFIANNDSTCLYFEIPNINSIADGYEFSPLQLQTSIGQTVYQFQSLLYVNRNLYDKNDLMIFEKNLFNQKEIIFLNAINSQILNNIETDGNITITVLGMDFDTGYVDILVGESFKYLNGKERTITYRKSVILKKVT